MRKYRRKIGNFARSYKRAIIIMGLVLALGLILGSVYAATINGDKLNETESLSESALSVYDAQAEERFLVFTSAVKSDIIPLMLVWVFGLSSIFIPFIFAEILVRGFKMGFSVGVMVRLFKLRGLFLAVSSTFIQNVFFIPVFIMLAVYSIKSAVKFKKLRKLKDKAGKRKILVQNIVVLSGIALTAVFCGVAEGYASTYLVRFFAG